MSIWSILYNILIMPLQLFFEVIFMLANRIIDNPGLSIIVLSLAMNFLVLPLYRRADAMQEEERDIEAKLHDGVKHIKKTFKGDERMMILNIYYRQNGYKPTYVFRGAISLFLEIPFFIAAYQFLSHLELLQGVAFGPLKDLGTADALIAVGGAHINLLPIIMTAVNLVSCVIFTKGYPTKTKVQLYSMAIFFFFFLYSSPSGLVFYWTLNNIFSLVKTIFYKLKNARQILCGMAAAVGIADIGYTLFKSKSYSLVHMCAMLLAGVLFLLPLMLVLFKKYTKIEIKVTQTKHDSKMFWMGALFLVILVGILIPSAVIQCSPQEFYGAYYHNHPLWYVCSSLCLAIGTFLIWFGVFYWLADEKVKYYFEIAMCVLSGVAIVNYMFFGKNLGIISSVLKYEDGMIFTAKQQLMNLLIVGILAFLILFISKHWGKYIPQILLIGTLAMTGMSVSNVGSIQKSIAEAQEATSRAQKDNPYFSLSKSGKNVVVFMLDRAMNEFFPYIINEKPELKDSFSGFTYYENTLSFGECTNIGTPALFGGYEYTPAEINKRDTESLAEKQNEALKVMPVLFSENGYKVTVCDPSYANYQWIPDTSIYDEYEGINAYVTNGKFTDKESEAEVITSNKRNFFCYSVMKILPLCVQNIVYDDGNYNRRANLKQTLENPYVADGVNMAFLRAYSVLENLSVMTEITNTNDNTFLMMTNDTTHEPMLLQEPEYEPKKHVDNTSYEKDHSIRYSENGEELHLQTDEQYMHYQVNVAALQEMGKWMDYLKENGVYDNTRIIIVADHGTPIQLKENMMLREESIYDTEAYYPLLLVKDFGSGEFSVSEEFMTNGDVPTLAMEGMIANPINPFTGNEINSDEKYLHDQYVLASDKWDIAKNNGNQFLPGAWLSVHDDVRVKSNWTIVEEDTQ